MNIVMNSKQEMKILLAEDDSYQRLALIDILTLCGYDVTAVENGRLARDQLLDKENRFNLVLSDLDMPEMNGYELLCLIKSEDTLRNIPVVIMSSDKQVQVMSNCIDRGAVEYIIKPIRINDVRRFKKYLIVDSCVDRQHQDQQSTYQMVRQIYKGSDDSIDLIQSNLDDQQFIMKVIPMHFMAKNEKKQIQNEIQTLKVLNGPSIIQYYESFIKDNQIHIVMEYSEKGTLSDQIRRLKSQNKCFSDESILYQLGQIIIAIMVIHSQNMVHRNIKPQNIFVSKPRVSNQLGTQNQLAKTFQETPYSMPPEVCAGQTYNYKSDVWAIGCVLYEMVTKSRPFQATQLQQVFKQIIQNQPDPLPANVDSNIQLLVKLMLNKNPNNRPSIWSLAQIPIIQNNIIQFAQDYDYENDINHLYSNLDKCYQSQKFSQAQNIERSANKQDGFQTFFK